MNAPLLLTKRADAVAVVSINDDPLNRMSLAFIDQLEEVVEDIAIELAAQPRLAVKAILDALHSSEDKTLDELLAAERRGVHATSGTADAQEGMLAFLEKRPPVFNQ